MRCTQCRICTADMLRCLLIALLVAHTTAQSDVNSVQCHMSGGRFAVKPGALTSVTATPTSSRTARISWGPPANEGCYTGVIVRWLAYGWLERIRPTSDPLYGYGRRITLQRTFPYTSTAAEIRGLREDTRYMVTVAAASRYGEGPFTIVQVKTGFGPAFNCRVGDRVGPPSAVTDLAVYPGLEQG